MERSLASVAVLEEIGDLFFEDDEAVCCMQGRSI